MYCHKRVLIFPNCWDLWVLPSSTICLCFSPSTDDFFQYPHPAHPAQTPSPSSYATPTPKPSLLPWWMFVTLLGYSSDTSLHHGYLGTCPPPLENHSFIRSFIHSLIQQTTFQCSYHTEHYSGLGKWRE